MGFANYTNAQLENLIEQTYSGSINPSNLPVDLYSAIVSRLMVAVKKGMGIRGSSSFVDGSPDDVLFRYFQHNIAVFSGAKTHQQVNDMSNIVFKSDGFKRDFSEFRRLIKGDEFHNGIFNQYNDNWLRTEFDTAFGTAQMGREWNAIVEDADVLPYLKYIAVSDERVRQDHKEFDGVTLPVGHAWWDSHMPTNGFNCRCRVIQLSIDDVEQITSDNDLNNIPDVDPDLFSFNPGKKGFIFNETKHPYFTKVAERYSAQRDVNFGLPTPPKPVEPIVTPTIPKPKPIVTKPKPKPKQSNEFNSRIENVSDVKELKKLLNESLTKNGIKVDKITLTKQQMPLSQSKRYVAQLNNLLNEYEIYKGAQNIPKMNFRSSRGAYGFVRFFSSRLSKPMIFTEFNAGNRFAHFSEGNRKFSKDYKKTRHKSRVDEMNNDISTITHEFAHWTASSECLEYGKINEIDSRMTPFFTKLREIRNRYTNETNALFYDRQSGKISPDEYSSKLNEIHLGRYARTNIDEFLAESFTEYKLSSNPSPYAVEVGELFDKYFKK